MLPYIGNDISPTPSARPTLLHALELTGGPAPIEIAWLRLDLLAINKALPWHAGGIEGQIAPDVLEGLGRRFVTPDLAVGGLGTLRLFQRPVASPAFPFAEAAFIGDFGQEGGEGGGEGGAGEVVCWSSVNGDELRCLVWGRGTVLGGCVVSRTQ